MVLASNLQSWSCLKVGWAESWLDDSAYSAPMRPWLPKPPRINDKSADIGTRPGHMWMEPKCPRTETHTRHEHTPPHKLTTEEEEEEEVRHRTVQTRFRNKYNNVLPMVLCVLVSAAGVPPWSPGPWRKGVCRTGGSGHS